MTRRVRRIAQAASEKQLSEEGPRCLVVGASGGIGGAMAETWRASGALVETLSRTSSGPLPFDVTDEASVAAAAARLAAQAPFDRVLIATGFLHDAVRGPEKSLRMLEADGLARAFAINAIGPALCAKHLLPLMRRDGRGVFAVLSARVGSIADNRAGGWYGYRASKAALNQIVRTLAVETGRTHPHLVVAALHPGTVATRLSAPFRAPEDAFTPAVAAGHLARVMEGLTKADSGGFFAWDGTAIPF